MSRGRKILIAVVVALALGVATVSEFLRSDRGVEVRAELAAEREVISTITAIGQIRARNQVNISSEVMGRVVDLTVEEGDEVQEGQVLLTIDPRQVEAAVSRAAASLSQTEAQVAQQRANLEQSERDLARLIELRGSGVVTQQEVEAAQTRVEVQRATLTSSQHGVDQARAALTEAQDQLSKTTIRAPIAGKVTRLNIKEGETAVVGTMNNAGSLLLTIADLSAVEAVMILDETDIPEISVGDSAVVGIDAFPDRTFPARVVSIANSAITSGGTAQNRGSVSFEVILSLIDPPPDLRPDLSATADIIVERRAHALAVPIISVTTRTDEGEIPTTVADDGAGGPIERANRERPQDGVFVVRDDRAVWTPVTLGITGQEHFEILSGLEAGELVVSGPYQTIRTLMDGTQVRVTEEPSPPAAP